jgi:hypothetical protein
VRFPNLKWTRLRYWVSTISLCGDRLDTWISQVRADDLPHLHLFATGLQRDRTAGLNGLTLQYSSGPLEGNVNPYQNDQAADVWPREVRPAPQTNPARRLTQTNPYCLARITESESDPEN